MLSLFLLGAQLACVILGVLTLWRVGRVESALASSARKKAPTRRPRKKATTSVASATGGVIPSTGLPLALEPDPSEPPLPLSTDRGGAFADAYDPDLASHPLRKLRSVME